MPARSFIPPNSIAEYGAMIGDRLRADAYAAALRQAVRADSVVLDIGTGAGTFALLACQLGARRVIGVEPGDVIELARELAVANGYVDRMELIQDVSTSITLAEPADVIVSDLRGAVPLHGRHLPAVIDARMRLSSRECRSRLRSNRSRERFWTAFRPISRAGTTRSPSSLVWPPNTAGSTQWLTRRDSPSGKRR